ncbi:SDR family oxidoreductase [Mycetocola reblochoni]|uniref:Short-chain dehydrogenase/oxidoreductase n=2 Tax=Mycetocola reblochoni TaxID=331618 RepID=A0A1R4KAG5_9MICO|nr:SDR family oxidoreductase [Mycetocola reblochoni]RLP71203.1 SDR family oxidoreductase [Mycetocola reblochoni]SJN41297.1 Short-chain dehydrogenase/oxidoreductase [Mycetocola reblochoni REB411]
MSDVLVVIGVGGMGETIARRLAPGRTTVLADFNETLLATLAESLTVDGFDVVTQQVDVSSRASVRALAQTAATHGPVTTVVDTAGLSPAQAPIEAILRVDLVGVALVLEEFAEVLAPGAAGVVISSSSGYISPGFTPEQEQQIRTTPADGLLALDAFSPEALGSPGMAYGKSKRANRLQVQEASALWGAKGARVNSVSPGVISTAMGRQELGTPSGAFMRAMVENSGTGRIGTPSDIADAVTFLVGPQASYITGIDLLVDGGNVAAVQTGRVPLPGR